VTDTTERLRGRGDPERERPTLRATVLCPLQRPVTEQIRTKRIAAESRAAAFRQERSRVELLAVSEEHGS
jgi:hypothetical protein